MAADRQLPPEGGGISRNMPPEGGSIDRNVPLESGGNMRDLGGLPLAGDAQFRRRRIYRSAALNALTAADRLCLTRLGLKSVVDLRSPLERAHAPSRLPEGLRIVTPGDGSVDAAPGNRYRPDPMTEADARRMMCEGYRTYPLRMAAAIGATLRVLVEGQGGLLFHCAGGKDRSGFVAAVILLTAGASHETVLEDYLATDHVWNRKSARLSGMPGKVQEAVFTARAEYLEAALAALEQEFGTVEDYLTGRCRVDARTLARVRAALVETI